MPHSPWRPEFQQELVQSVYQQYLRRPPDPAGLIASLTNLQHCMSDQTLAADIVGSDEFFGGM